MLFHPAQLGLAHLDKATLEADKKACKKIGPCGVGKKALYLNSFYIDRRYYLPYGSISRVFKRVAMSQGGFSGKGMFASMAYLVVEYDGGKQKQCNFKDERDVDALLEVLAKEQPNILRAAGDASFTMTVSIVSMWVFRVGFCYLWVLKMGGGLLSIWMGMYLDWAFRSICFMVRFVREKWLEQKVI